MFLRRISGLSKLAAWFLVIFVSDSIWSSFLLTILGRKLFYSLFVQTVKSLSKRKCPWILGLLRCISNHPVHIRRWSPLKLKKQKKRKGKKKQRPRKRQTNKKRKTNTRKAIGYDSFVRHIPLLSVLKVWEWSQTYPSENVQKRLPFSLLLHLLNKNLNDNYFLYDGLIWF